MPELTAGQLWAESTTLAAELAARMTERQRPRLISAWPVLVDEHEWMRERLRRLRAELQRRVRHVR